MAYSHHSKKQMQRRGITLEYVELINQYGEDINSNNKCTIRRISHDEMASLKYDQPALWRRYRDKRATSVVSAHNDVVTVKHQFRKLWSEGI